MRSPQPSIPKPAKSSAPPESHVRPGYETPAISAGAAVARRARYPRRKLACFCSAPMAGFYSAVDTPEWNRGAYLVEALGHCGECHTPRNLLYGLSSGRKFAGAIINGWKAYNITSDPAWGIGAWTSAQLAD